MKHSFTSAQLLDIAQAGSQDYEYDNDKRRGIHVDLSPLKRLQPLVLSYQNITGVIAAACCKITSSERDIKGWVEPSSKNEVKGQSAARLGVLRFFRDNLLWQSWG
jgi:hypothetical protein